MENWLSAPWEILVKTALSVIAIYIGMLVVTRFSGLRTFAKMSSIDFASTIAIGSVLASIILDSNHSIAKGLVALVFIILFQSISTLLYRKSNKFQKLFNNSALFLMKDGKILHENLKKANVDKSDLMAKLREANVHQFSEVNAVIFETTGDVSVLHSSAPKKIDAMIIEDVDEE